jgi:hypothetical protein
LNPRLGACIQPSARYMKNLWYLKITYCENTNDSRQHLRRSPSNISSHTTNKQQQSLLGTMVRSCVLLCLNDTYIFAVPVCLSHTLFCLPRLHAIVALTFSKHISTQIFLSFFKTLVGKEVAVELKNDVVLVSQRVRLPFSVVHSFLSKLIVLVSFSLNLIM